MRTTRAPHARSKLTLVLGSTLLAGSLVAADGDALHALRPDVAWSDTAVIADYDGDGTPDRAFLGHTSEKVFVGVLVTAAKQPQVLVFAVSDDAHAAVCSADVTLTEELLDYDPSQVPGGLEGFRLSGTAKGLQLSDDECDPIHLYWNTVARRMEWWRL